MSFANDAESLIQQARLEEPHGLEVVLGTEPVGEEELVNDVSDDIDAEAPLRDLSTEQLELFLQDLSAPQNNLLNPTQMDTQVPTDDEPQPRQPRVTIRFRPFRPEFINELIARYQSNQSAPVRDHVPLLEAVPDTVQKKGGRRSRSGALNAFGEQRRNERLDISLYFKRCAVERFRAVQGMIDRSRETCPELWETKYRESKVIINYMHLWQASLNEKWRRVLIGEVKQLKEWEAQVEECKLAYDATALRIRESVCMEDFAEVDRQLLEWLHEQRAKNKRVTWNQLAEVADEIAASEYKKAVAAKKETKLKPRVSTGFLYRWRCRHNIVLKRIKKQVTVSDEEVDDRLQKFLEHVYRNVRLCQAVINFDEIPMSLCGSMGINRTVTLGSDSAVVVRSDANDTKRIATLIPIAGCKRSPNGGWQPFHVGTIIIFIGSPKQARVLNEKYYPGVTVAWTRCGVMTADLMLSTVVPMIRAACDKENIPTCLVILDSAKSHTTPAVVRALKSQRTPPSVIPAGMTSFIQWVDVFFAAKYRSLHLNQYSKWEGVRKTASQKRRLMAKIVGITVPSMLLEIVRQFEYLGYLDASKCATIPGRPYFFFLHRPRMR